MNGQIIGYLKIISIFLLVELNIDQHSYIKDISSILIQVEVPKISKSLQQ